MQLNYYKVVEIDKLKGENEKLWAMIHEVRKLGLYNVTTFCLLNYSVCYILLISQTPVQMLSKCAIICTILAVL